VKIDLLIILNIDLKTVISQLKASNIKK